MGGTSYFDDLYLDFVVYPDGSVIIDDMDELEAALYQHNITEKTLPSDPGNRRAAEKRPASGYFFLCQFYKKMP